ncbi:cytochrome c [Echinicola jeungdonensis]|uniref:C-type cytochrome n=1 Tax=Echinicola jeungdonensis TaxID=709343 RepID=A0ABV5J4Q9_9BACT|nr:cytochrome c [Echinicola jeungdonensis]MDN3670574.1 cytochrome c [Echinicola jeungdonensis]
MKIIIISCLMVSYMGWTAFNAQNQDDPLKESIKRGKEVYNDFCLQCHMADGQGVKDAFPPLAESDFLLQKRKESIKAVMYGMSGEITVNEVVYNGNMSNQGLYDDEVADVMNYILNSWGNKSEKMVTEEEVKSIKKEVEEKKAEQ